MRLIGFLFIFRYFAANAEENVPLNTYPMIMSHDAGSGYLKTYSGIEELVLKWTMTQSAGFLEQLQCGARAFDARPAMNNDGELVWHHGGIVVNYSFVSSVNDVIEWCGENPNELVLLDIVDCSGDGCNEAVASALADANVSSITNCDWFENATLAGARHAAALANGGQLLALTGGCTNMNYVPSIACSGYNRTNVSTSINLFYKDVDRCLRDSGLSLDKSLPTPLAEDRMNLIKTCATQLHEGFEALSNDGSLLKGVYRCYDNADTNEFPLNRMFDYLDSTSESYGPILDGQLWQMQALWEETDESVALGIIAKSSLLKDETRSSLNSRLTSAVESNRWSEISLLEVNNVCDGGPELFSALRNWWARRNDPPSANH